MRFKRTKSRCASCPLAGTPKVHGKGLMQGVAFFGEAPGSEEVSMLEPFIGPAGTYLSWVLAKAGIERSQNWVSNVVTCKIPKNDWDSIEGENAQTACSFGLMEELETLRKAGVRVIVTLGANATHAFGIEGNIGKIRGSVFEAYGFWVIPTYHPSWFQRLSRHRGDDSVLDKKYSWVCDLLKAKRIAREGWEPAKENFILNPSVDEVMEWIREGLIRNDLFAVDIETSGWSETHGEIVVVGLARDSENALSVPFLRQGGESYFAPFEQGQVLGALDALFTTGRLMFQNALFDVGYLRGKGFHVNYSHVEHDTMLLHHAISPEQEHNLGYIVSIYGDTPYWKGDFLGRAGSILEMPDDDLRRYNLRDCVVLHQILGPMLEDLEAAGQTHIYQNESLRLLAPIAEMMETGLKLDTRRLYELRLDYERQTQELALGLRSAPTCHLPDGFNLDSGDDIRWLLYGARPKKFDRLGELAEYFPETATKLTKDGKPRLRKTTTKKYQDLLALQEIATTVQPFRRPMGFKPRSTDGGALQVDEQALLSLDLHMNNRLADIAKFKSPTEAHLEERALLEAQRTWLKTYREYREVGKIVSTYLDFKPKLDGKVHTRFLIHGTATGRLSSREPNLQNLPKERLEIRSVFTADSGKTLVSGDFSNLEVYILAYETRDEALISMLESGLNMHDENTRILFGLEPSDPRWKPARNAAKIFMFGGISYGGGDREIYEKVLLKAPELGLQFSELVRAKNRWMAAHPGYATWADLVQRTALATRKSCIFNGRCRELMGKTNDIKKQALNSPIQGGAAAVINQALIRFYTRKPEPWKLVVQIHDQLVVQVPDSDVDECVALLREEMSRPVEIHGSLRSIPVDFETGKSLGTLKSYKGEKS